MALTVLLLNFCYLRVFLDKPRLEAYYVFLYLYDGISRTFYYFETKMTHYVVSPSTLYLVILQEYLKFSCEYAHVHNAL